MLRLKRPALAAVALFFFGTGVAAVPHARGGTSTPSSPQKTGAASANQANSASTASQHILIRAIQLHQAGDFGEAIREYKKYLALDPGNFVARANLGAALAHEGEYVEAIKEYEKALSIQPGNPEVKLNLALAHYKAMQLGEAVGELLPLHTAQPGNLKIGLLLGDCYFRLGEYKKAARLLQPLEAAYPHQQALDYLLGLSLIRDGQIAQGEVLVNKILSHGDSPEAHLMLGEARLAVNDTPGAIDELSKALKLDPKIPLVHWLYGKALLESGQRPEAMQAFRQELAIDPNEYGPNVYLGALLNEGQKYNDALLYLARALEVRPGAPQVKYQIAVAQIGLGKLALARKTLTALAQHSPNFVEAHVSLALVDYRLHLKQDGDRERAIVAKLNAEIQAKKEAMAAKPSYDGTATPPGGKAPGASPEAASPKKPVAPPPGPPAGL
ncbi:MAG: tetratricopeptide repeat protein [Terriglobia bacterium]